jgi:selenophosphate synthase
LLSLFYDPQTSGGLLIASTAAAAGHVAARLREAGVAAQPIGIATVARAGVSIIVQP